jgi:hypothetical protein
MAASIGGLSEGVNVAAARVAVKPALARPLHRCITAGAAW